MQIKDNLTAVWDQMLGALDGWLAKAEAHPSADALMEAKLADDMHPLAVQVRFVCNMPGEAVQRLCGIDFTSNEDNPAALAEARARIAETRSAIEGWAKNDFIAGDAAVELSLPNGMSFDLTAEQYARDWAISQYYFHIVTAYAILRAAGLEIGKIDFLPFMLKYMRAAG